MELFKKMLVVSVAAVVAMTVTTDVASAMKRSQRTAPQGERPAKKARYNDLNSWFEFKDGKAVWSKGPHKGNPVKGAHVLQRIEELRKEIGTTIVVHANKHMQEMEEKIEFVNELTAFVNQAMKNRPLAIEGRELTEEEKAELLDAELMNQLTAELGDAWNFQDKQQDESSSDQVEEISSDEEINNLVDQVDQVFDQATKLLSINPRLTIQQVIQAVELVGIPVAAIYGLVYGDQSSVANVLSNDVVNPVLLAGVLRCVHRVSGTNAALTIANIKSALNQATDNCCIQ